MNKGAIVKCINTNKTYSHWEDKFVEFGYEDYFHSGKTPNNNENYKVVVPCVIHPNLHRKMTFIKSLQNDDMFLIDSNGLMLVEDNCTKLAEEKENKDMERIENKKEMVTKKVAEEIIECLNHYKWDMYTTNAINKIANEWWEMKKDIIASLSTLPEWDWEQLALIFSHDFKRDIDNNSAHNACSRLINYLDDNKSEFCEEKSNKPLLDKYDISDAYEQVRKIIQVLETYKYNVVYCGYRYEDIPELIKRKQKLSDIYSERYKYENYTKESVDKYQYIYKCLSYINDYVSSTTTHIINQRQADELNQGRKEVGLHGEFRTGQKFTKIIGKLCKEIGLDKKYNCYNSFSKEIAIIGDSLSPITFTKHTIFSVHPIDYLRSSMGSSWSSCHTIDRANVDERKGSHYEGMHANGTMSYMLDSSTVVFYTVNEEYNGNKMRWQDKDTREMFHIGTKDNPFFIQGRLYPQDNDCGAENAYKQTRSCVQEILSRAWGVTNLWSAPSSPREYIYLVNESGTNYRDYFEYHVCKISFLKDFHKEFKEINIGAMPICITCGERNSMEDNQLSCCEDFNDGHYCYECNSYHSEDEMHYIDGEWYCGDCCFYCYYHGEWEIGTEYDYTYVGDNRVCNYAINDSGDFVECEECGDIVYVDDCITAEDGTIFCDERCAENYGYIIAYDGCLYPENHIEECCECGGFFNRDDLHEVDGMYCCDSCHNEEN